MKRPLIELVKTMLAIDRSISLAATAFATVLGAFFSVFSGHRSRRYSESMMQIQSPTMRRK